MILSKTTQYKITFTVEAHWNEEGGMGHDSYGQRVETLEEAVNLLELARNPQYRSQIPKGVEWQIICDVATVIKKS